MKNVAMALLFALSFLIAAPSHALIAPPYITANKMKAALEADPCVQVKAPSSWSNPFVIQVQACSQEIAQALAALLNPSHDQVEVRVVDAAGKPVEPARVSTLGELADLVSSALRGNPYFSKAYPYSPMGLDPRMVVLDLKPQVIQVFIDNIGNPYGTSAFVAADLFREIFNAQVGDAKLPLAMATAPH